MWWMRTCIGRGSITVWLDMVTTKIVLMMVRRKCHMEENSKVWRGYDECRECNWQGWRKGSKWKLAVLIPFWIYYHQYNSWQWIWAIHPIVWPVRLTWPRSTIPLPSEDIQRKLSEKRGVNVIVTKRHQSYLRKDSCKEEQNVVQKIVPWPSGARCWSMVASWEVTGSQTS